MAKTIGVKLDFDTKGAKKSTEEFAKSVEKATTTLGGLEEQQDELLAKLKETQIGTKEFQELSKELNKTKSQIKDLELGFEGLDMEQRFTAATDAIGGVAGGFAAVQGAIAIAGVESEEFEKTMLKVQGAMALAMGIKDISTAAAAIKKLNLVTKAWNLVTKANPLVLILSTAITVIGFVVGKLGFLEDAMNAVGDAVNWVGRQLGLLPSKAEQAAAAQAKLAAETLKQESEKLQAVADAEQKKREAREESYDFEIAKLQAAGKETYAVEQEKLKYVLDSLAKQKAALKEKLEFEQNSNAQGAFFRSRMTALELEDLTEQEEKAQQTITLNEIKETKKRNDASAKAASEAAKKRKDDAKKAEDDRKKEAERLAAQEKAERDARIANIEDDEERELAINKAKFQDKLNELRKQGILTNELRNELLETFNKEQEDIEFKYAEEKRLRDKQNEEELAAQKIAIKEQADAEIEKKRQEDLEREQAIAEAKNLLQDSVAKGALALTDLLVKDSQKADRIQKAVALAQIAIDTAKAISSLTANSEANPANAVTGGLAGIAQFASGIARILANMAQAAALLKKPAPNVSGVSAGSASAASAGVPINAVNNGSTLIQQPGSGKEVNKVVVVESDITSTQGTISGIEAQATVVE